MPFAEDSNHVKFSLWEKQFLNEKRHGAQGTGRKNGLRRAAGGKSAGYRGQGAGGRGQVLRSLLKRHIAYNTSPIIHDYAKRQTLNPERFNGN